eukprot:TRINITY_DN10955_c1_g1_i1.p2 TRINITY_DN10955_c1_g1~~TRINITY_DN10955_c1_g1_i1.p2  ORF type:complete len:101 (-),score=11.73 TRINITY_DN10955_c1_g1_i1:99-401(-)
MNLMWAKKVQEVAVSMLSVLWPVCARMFGQLPFELAWLILQFFDVENVMTFSQIEAVVVFSRHKHILHVSSRSDFLAETGCSNLRKNLSCFRQAKENIIG